MSEVVVRLRESAVVDAIEREFDACKHPYAVSVKHPWCNVCGACTVADGVWVKPHWRDIVAAAMRKM